MKHAFVAAALLATLAPLAAPPVNARPGPVQPHPRHQRGSVLKVESLGVMDRAQAQKIAAAVPGKIDVRTGAELFRVTYWTVLKGKPVEASGLLSIPLGGAAPKGVVLYLHGSNATRALAPSQPDRVDGIDETAIFAGNGYLTVLPDYIGMGVSKIPHPFLVAQPEVDASIDLLRAVRTVVAQRKVRWASNLFMMGFSQGGQVVAGVHRALEAKPQPGLRLRGSIGVAGPYELRRTSLPRAIESNCRLCVGYLAWAAYGLSSFYGHPMGEAIKPEFVDVVPRLFDGSKYVQEIGAALPDDPADLFQPEFLNEVRTGKDNWFTRALDRNETYRWRPIAPVRLYHGEMDTDVPFSASQAFYDHAKPRGGNVRLISLGPVDHQASIALVYAPAFRWFENLTASKN